MDKIISGARHFHDTVFRGQRDWFVALAHKQQKPRALFITCADSRINPNLITQTEPGDLFILRNAGNIIPPYGAASGGEGATIEYAVAVLGIRNLIICGHSHCGAMGALLQNQGLEELPAVRRWFNHAEATRQILRRKYAHLDDPAARLLAAVQENVLVQMDNLRTHPAVASGLAGDELRLYGWVYVIETGDILAYDPTQRAFLSITEEDPSPVPNLPRLNQAPPA